MASMATVSNGSAAGPRTMRRPMLSTADASRCGTVKNPGSSLSEYS